MGGREVGGGGREGWVGGGSGGKWVGGWGKRPLGGGPGKPAGLMSGHGCLRNRIRTLWVNLARELRVLQKRILETIRWL